MDVDQTISIKNNTIAHDSGFGNDAAAVSNWVNGTQKVGYVETVSNGAISVSNKTISHDSFSTGIDLGSSTSMTYCGSCSSYYWGWPHSCNHYITPYIFSPPVHAHHYVQAQAPHESTIFCEGCGDMKRLKAGKKENQ